MTGDPLPSRPVEAPGLGHHLSRRREGLGGLPEALGLELVEVGGEPLGQPARVGEDDGRAVFADQVEDPVLHVRPDGGWPPRGLLVLQRARRGRGCRGSEVTHVLDRNHDRQVPGLLRGWSDDGDRVWPAEIAGHPLRRPDGGRETDPLERPPAPSTTRLGGERLQPLQRQTEMGPALGAGQRVHLVDDHRLHRGQDVPRGRGQHQEQRLRSGDHDVRRPGDQGPAVGRRGVTRPYADRHVGQGLSEPDRGLGDPGQWGAQVSLDVNGQGLQRRHVEHPAPLLRRRLRRAGEVVERPEECGESLSRPCGRDHQGVLPRSHGLPRPGLGGGGRGEDLPEPRGRGQGEHRERVVGHVVYLAFGH